MLTLNSRFQKFLKMLIDDLYVRCSALCVRSVPLQYTPKRRKDHWRALGLATVWRVDA